MSYNRIYKHIILLLFYLVEKCILHNKALCLLKEINVEYSYIYANYTSTIQYKTFFIKLLRPNM